MDLEKCKISGKVCFPNKKIAKTKLNRIFRAKRKERASRIYLCPSCNTWHLTSMLEYKPSIKQNTELKYSNRWKDLIK